jgi:BirA family biotin operon repressor/biotin-[acetyl-CoA-carboxylase] ligase
VIGIGLNVAATAQDLGYELRDTATSLQIASGRAVSREAVLSALFECLGGRLADLESGQAAELLDRYRERDVLTGGEIAWIAADEERTGRVQGIDDSGNLVVVTPDGARHALESGEVHLLRR